MSSTNLPATPAFTDELFGCALSACPLADRTVGHQQAVMRAAAGDRPLRFGDRVVASETFIRWFLQLAQGAERANNAATRVGPADLAYGLKAEAGADLVHHDLSLGPPGPDSTPVVVPAIEDGTHRSFPGWSAEPVISPVGASFVWTIDEWPDLIAANLLALQASVATIGGAATRSAAVHPTAIVENCRLGDGVTVGPYAVVRNSIVEDGATVEGHGDVQRSVLGQGATVHTAATVHRGIVGAGAVIGPHSVVVESVLFGRSTVLARAINRSLIGHDVFVGSDVVLGFLHPDGRSVRQPGARIATTGPRLLGCAIGSGSRLGDGARLDPGTEVPAATTITSTHDHQIAHDHQTASESSSR